MALKRTLNAIGSVAAAAALLLAVAPVAHADAARDKQWALQAFKAQQRVWPLSKGEGVTVAVIDSPIRATHVDLLGQLLPGKDFASSAAPASTSNGHGTMVASLIAGHGHGASQSEGIMGLAPDVKILPLTVNVNASTVDEQVGAAIRYAVDHDAGVINISLGGTSRDPSEQSAVAYAESHNVIVVAGAGNDGAGAVYFPAALPGVLSVGGATQDGSAWSESNYGPGLVLVAPAVGILGDDNGTDTQYSIGDGTSYATAYVSAAAALVRSKYPNLTAGQVINRLIKTAIDPNAKPGQTTPDPHFGYGVLRPDAALTANIAAGPAAGPLAQATDPLAAGGKGTAEATPVTAAKSGSGSSGMGMGAVLGIAAVVVVLLVVLAFVVLSRRRRARAGSSAAGQQQLPPYGQQPQYPQQYAQGGQNPAQYPPAQYPSPQYPQTPPPPPPGDGSNPPPGYR